MSRKFMREIRVGGVILAALTVIVVFVFTLGSTGDLMSNRVKYHVYFSTTAGLFEGDPVLLTGVEVGNVDKIGFPEDLGQKKIYVEISVDKVAARRIREDTRARVGSASIVYGKVVTLTMGSPDLPSIPPGGEIPADASAGFSAMMDSTSLVIDGLHSMVSKINRGDGMLGMLLNDPMEMRETLHHLAVTTEKLSLILEKVEAGKGPMGTLLSDTVEIHSTLKNLHRSTVALNRLTERMNHTETLWGRVVNDTVYGKAVTRDLERGMHAFANIAVKLDTAEGSLGMLLNDPQLYIGMQDVVVGTQNSRIAKWLIRGRREAGEAHRHENARTGEEH